MQQITGSMAQLTAADPTCLLSSWRHIGISTSRLYKLQLLGMKWPKWPKWRDASTTEHHHFPSGLLNISEHSWLGRTNLL